MSNTESFESAANSYDHYVGFSRIVVKEVVKRLKRAHDREIRDTAQREYHRGFEDGQHSMDAKHRAVAMRLRQLPRGCTGFSDAHVSWFSDLAWAMGIKEPTFAVLRDELVRLMGGVSDENVHVGGLRCDDGCMGDVSNGEDTGRAHDSPSNRDRNHMAVREGVDTVIGDGDGTCDSQCRGACAADCGRDSGEQEEVEHGGTTHDCGADSRCGSGSDVVHLDGVTYDTLSNERRKAVCELRNARDIMSDSMADNVSRIMCAIDARPKVGERACKAIADRLIHLLGGDQPSGIDVLHEMDEREAEGRITDELREFVDDNWPTELKDARILREAEGSVPHSLLLIADRIDAKHYLTSVVAEASTSDAWIAMSEYDKLRWQRDELRAELEELRGHSRTCPKSSGDVSESAPSVSITDELRKWASDRHCKGMSHTDVLNIGLIADRIDAQFDRICAQQEAVLQKTIAEVVEERDHWKQVVDIKAKMLLEISGENVSLEAECEKLEKQRDEAIRMNESLREQRDEWTDEAISMYRALFPSDEYGVPQKPSTMVIASIEKLESQCEERDRLQERLRTAELGCDANHRLAEANARWADDLLDLLRDAREEYKTLSQMSARTRANFYTMRDRFYTMRDRASVLEAERDNLLDLLRDAREEYVNAQ